MVRYFNGVEVWPLYNVNNSSAALAEEIRIWLLTTGEVRREGNSFTWDGRETHRFFSPEDFVIGSGTNELSHLLACVRC